MAAGGAGAGYLYLRWKADQDQTSSCEALGSLIGGIAGTAAGPGDATANANAQRLTQIACNLLGNADQIINGVSNVGFGISDRLADGLNTVLGRGDDGRCNAGSAQKKKNEELNGPVTARAHEKMPSGQIVGGVCHKSLNKRVDIPLRHQNGCVPYQGAPGWEKCKPGTTSLTTDGANPARIRAIGSGRVGVDPFSFKDSGERAFRDPFPEDVPAGGTAYWINGQPFVCAGTVALDHRSGREGQVVCLGGAGTGVIPPHVGDHPRNQVPSPDGDRDHR